MATTANTTLSYEQVVLMKRMAWRNMQPRTLDEFEVHYTHIAINMLICVACIDYFLIYLSDDLEEAGLLRHNTKRMVRRAQELASYANGEAYRVLSKVERRAGRQYNQVFDYCAKQINNHVLLSGIERDYNIVVSLVRLLKEYNRQLGDRYYYTPAHPLYKIPDMLSSLGVQDHNIDLIIRPCIEVRE